MTTEVPRWEWGYRVHGYWLGNQRVGHVGLTPRGISPVVYSWGIDVHPRQDGECSTLRGARRAVEAAWRAHVPGPPVTARPWWKDPPPARVGENCCRCRRWNPRFARVCYECGVATSWMLINNLTWSLVHRHQDMQGDPG